MALGAFTLFATIATIRLCNCFIISNRNSVSIRQEHPIP